MQFLDSAVLLMSAAQSVSELSWVGKVLEKGFGCNHFEFQQNLSGMVVPFEIGLSYQYFQLGLASMASLLSGKIHQAP